jgi:alkylation response protein AidB-like acyl-CoA dehydrogenase
MYFQMIFEEIIPEKQIRIAKDTRALVRRKIGLFSDYKLSTTYPDTVKPEIVRRARIFGALALQVQRVYGDANKPETSYFKINQEAAPINKTELFLLPARNKPKRISLKSN